MSTESLEFQLQVDEPLVREYSTRVCADSEFFRGHFPGHPVLPGVAQLEAIVFELATRSWPDLGPLRELRRLKFHRVIVPETPLRIALQRKADTKVKFTIARSTDALTFASGMLCFGESPDVG